MGLSDTRCRTVKPTDKIQKLSDGGGLQLWVMPNGSKLWRVAYRYGAKPKSLSLGAYPIVSLSDAREGRDEAKKLIAKSVDPSTAKRQAKAELLAAKITLGSLSAEYLNHQRLNKRAPATMTKLEWLLSLPDRSLREMPISNIRPIDILASLKKVEARGRYDTAHRLLSTLGSVFRFGVATGGVKDDPTPAFARRASKSPSKNRAALTNPKAFGGLLEGN